MNRTSGGQHLPSRVVYLGSIPYDQTEEQILDLCSNVGPVNNLKMMFDPQTGKSKGYAFVEYKDLESSASAVRNLNGYQFGSRLLKCGYATGTDMENNDNNNNSNNNNNNSNNMEDGTSLKFARLPAGIDVNINMTTPAMMISSELAKRNAEEQLGLLRNFQDWTRRNPEDAVELLRECPQLSFVIAEILLTNGISNVDDLTQLAVQRNDTPETGANGTDAPQDPNIQSRQRELLRQVLQLSDSEIAVLPDDEKMSLWDLKQRATRGEFGLI
ncbi:hypothetical protein ZYGR_0AD00570 [Zygosaccharomyces rouxii]|uniref:ZYRO0G07216p n=2 Tax=Zygosaccharomyces rouxii TaxID=4956 RepID=C5DZU1_ZYGRC|nr:uncharacterized protein ZYRO0G07216g [Zygosaccharomyces rouxii]KAH9202372.1 hypothetical protein LQ764DRAFT_232565 [Zygosaccharomyces rouxii]GAV50874.1 hypothetical protein ZYGR_0AD00570 [Zygosaccharomyces rouxii]CAR29375.1 ZYRO0G07216p [Zygosaccharomyces rouxii]